MTIDLGRALRDECGFDANAEITFNQQDRLRIFQSAPEAPGSFSGGQIVARVGNASCGGFGQLEDGRAARAALTKVYAAIPDDLCAKITRIRGQGKCTRETGVAYLFLSELEKLDQLIRQSNRLYAPARRRSQPRPR